MYDYLCNQLVQRYTAIYMCILRLYYVIGGTQPSWNEYVVAYTLTGYKCGLLDCHTSVTSFSLPCHGDTLLLGYSDGCIGLYSAADLSMLYYTDVHTACIPISDLSSAVTENNNTGQLSISLSRFC